MKTCKGYALSGLLVLSLVACKKPINHEKHIPSNAAMVSVLDMQQMTIKAFDMSLLLEENMFDKKPEDDKSKKKIPIEESGIDFLNKSYIIGHVADNEADNYIGLILPVNDPYKFRNFALSYAIKKPGEGSSNVTYVFVNDGAILGWNTKSAIYLQNQNIKDESSLTSELFRLFDLPEEHQMTLQNESFRKTQEETFDISFWFDLNKINKYRNPLGMIIPGQRVSKGIYNAWIDFEKGAMNVKTRYYAIENEDNKRDGALVLKESIDKELFEGVKGERVVGTFNLGLNMPLIKTQLSEDGMLDSSHSYLELVNSNSREIIEMLSGDLSSCLLKDGEDTNFLIALGIKDPVISNKIIASLAEFGLIKKYENFYTLFNQYYIFSEKHRLLISSDLETIGDISGGDNIMPDIDHIKDLDSNPVVLFIDFNKLPIPSYLKMKKYWKDLPFETDEIESVYFTQSSINNGISDGKATVIFKNKDKNSLTIIAKAIKKISNEVES